jgi:threonine/homoserine/homoserine lactone efflux protein
VIDASNLLLFATASLLLILAPGPDVLFLISQSVTRGPKAGFETALGLAAGNLVHTCAAALGISVIFRASPVAFTALKLAGVLYLLFLAWKVLRERAASGETADGETPPAPAPAPSQRSGATFWRGFLMCVLNPKVALFFLAFLPQFALPAAGPIWAQMLILGAIFIVLVVLVFGLIGIFAGKLGVRLAGSRGGRASRSAKWVVATVYAALAARLAFVTR